MTATVLNGTATLAEIKRELTERVRELAARGVVPGLGTILVLSGVARAEEVNRYPFQPSRIVDSVADLIDEL